jgi:hypothetical protein
VVFPVVDPSRKIAAPDGIELTDIEPVIGPELWNEKPTLVVCPPFTVTVWDWSLYPVLLHRMVWLPTDIPLNVAGVVFPEYDPSR